MAGTRLRARLRARVARTLVALLDVPVSRQYGFDRGTPVDRPFIEGFLERHAGDVRGRVLEVKDASYAHRFGGDRVSAVDVVDIDAGNPRATLVADLDDPAALPAGAYDCIVLTQVLEFLRPATAVPSLYRALAPGGVLLVTVPFLCRLETPDSDLQRWSAAGLRRLLVELLPGAEVHTEQAGSVAASVALLVGLAVEDLGRGALARDDWRYPVVTLARVRRPS